MSNGELKDELHDKLRDQAFEYWEDNISEYIVDSGDLDQIYDHSDCEEANDIIKNNVYDKLSEYCISVEFDDLEINSIQKCCDLYDIIDNNCNRAAYEDQQYDEYRDRIMTSSEDSDPIDDLFDRN
jgi:hypothetical protein